MKKLLQSFLFGTKLTQDTSLNLGWLLFRLHIGLSMAIHAGWPKITGASAPAWFIKQVGEIGFTFPNPEFWAVAATWGEFIGGILIAIGFLTRFAALQLAFQFFVISFIWYNEPEPLTGMYFQQLLMWCYLLVVVAGAGRFSVDALVRRRQRDEVNTNDSFSVLVKALPLLVVTFLSISGWTYSPAKPVVSIEELTPYFGQWSGTLEYNDYGSKKWVSIPAELQVREGKKGNELTALFTYPMELSENETENWTIDVAGRYFNAAVVLKKRVTPSSLLFVTGKQGYDDNKKSYIRTTYHFSSRRLVISKEVGFGEGGSFLLRNRYVLHR